MPFNTRDKLTRIPEDDPGKKYKYKSRAKIETVKKKVIEIKQRREEEKVYEKKKEMEKYNHARKEMQRIQQIQVQNRVQDEEYS